MIGENFWEQKTPFCSSLVFGPLSMFFLSKLHDLNTFLQGEVLTLNRKAGRGAGGAFWISVELASVARLVYCPDPVDGQPSFAEAAAQTDPLAELTRDPELAVRPVGGHSSAVALLGCLLPQHLAHPVGEAVPAGEGGRLPAHRRLIALPRSFP